VATSSELEADAVVSATFPTVRRGYDPGAVDQFLADVAVELRRAEADAEAARLETKRLRRQLEDAHAELATSEPPTNEAIAALGDEAGRVIQAAQQSSLEIVAAAEAAAEEIRARAREEAQRIAEDARRDAEDFDGRLTGQADEVRTRLREEIRKARAEVATEADRIRAQARDDAAAMLTAAGDEAGRLRDEAEEAALTRREQAGSLSDERVAEADALAASRIADAEMRAAALVAQAEQARDVVLAELQAQRQRMEEHVEALAGVQARARADLGAARTMFAALLAEMDHVRLREMEVPSLDLELVVPAAAAAVAEVPEAEVAGAEVAEDGGEAESEPGGETETETEVADGGEEIVLGEVPGIEAEPDVEPLDWDEAETPGDAEIEALFHRVVSKRDDVDGAPPAVEAVVTVAAEDDWSDDGDWGYADDSSAHPDASAVLVVAGDESGADEFESGDIDDGEPSRQQRVLAALHRFALDTGEVPVVPSAESSNGGADSTAGDDVDVDLTEEAVEAEAELEFDRQPAAEAEAVPVSASEVSVEPFVAELVPAMTRKVKRALQEVENAAMDVDRTSGDAGIDVLAVFSEYLVTPASDAMALGFGSDVGSRDFAGDAEVVVRSVCGQWAEELAAAISASDRVAAPSVVRAARRAADSVAEDLALTAYTAGRDRAARSGTH